MSANEEDFAQNLAQESNMDTILEESIMDTQESTVSQTKSQSKSERKWQLKNAELRVVDIYSKKSSKLAPLLIKIEIKLKNKSKDDCIKIVGEYENVNASNWVNVNNPDRFGTMALNPKASDSIQFCVFVLRGGGL